MFFGVVIYMYFFDNEIHRDELVADWELAVNGQPSFAIDPLR